MSDLYRDGPPENGNSQPEMTWEVVHDWAAGKNDEAIEIMLHGLATHPDEDAAFHVETLTQAGMRFMSHEKLSLLYSEMVYREAKRILGS